jgi:hypothetical protein
MPKMTDSRRKKIQARQRQARAALRREKKAARHTKGHEGSGLDVIASVPSAARSC